MDIVYDSAFGEQVLKTYVRDGFILLLPEERKKRKVLLDYMAKDLELGRPYSELELNFRILDHYDAFEEVRAAMLEEGILRKEGSVFYRVK